MALLITDPLDIALGADGDLVLGADGGPYLTTGLAGVAQLCRTALLLFRGEWFQDLDAGVPWLANDTVTENQAILGKRFDEAYVRAAVRDTLLAVPGVLSITALAVALNATTRTLAITWAVRSVFGDTLPDTLTPTEVT
jgi:hypothetical protein